MVLCVNESNALCTLYNIISNVGYESVSNCDHALLKCSNQIMALLEIPICAVGNFPG